MFCPISWSPLLIEDSIGPTNVICLMNTARIEVSALHVLPASSCFDQPANPVESISLMASVIQNAAGCKGFSKLGLVQHFQRVFFIQLYDRKIGKAIRTRIAVARPNNKADTNTMLCGSVSAQASTLANAGPLALLHLTTFNYRANRRISIFPFSSTFLLLYILCVV